MELIKQRCDFIMIGKKFPSILIFPEGTTTNGKYIISFKRGAFAHMFPVKIFCLKYDARYFIKLKKKKFPSCGGTFKSFTSFYSYFMLIVEPFNCL